MTSTSLTPFPKRPRHEHQHHRTRPRTANLHGAGQPSCAPRFPRTARRGASSWPACRAKSVSAASSTCFATESSTVWLTSTSSTARLRPRTRRPKRFSSKIASLSPGSCVTAVMRCSWHWTWDSSSTGYWSSPSS